MESYFDRIRWRDPAERAFLQHLQKRVTGNRIDQKRDITSLGVAVPETITGLLFEEIAKQSKLLPFVHRVSLPGMGRQLVGTTISDAGWTEVCGSTKEITLDLRAIQLDAWKVAGYFAICNAALDAAAADDKSLSDEAGRSLTGTRALFDELVKALGGSIGKAVDKAILYGTGAQMPVGICTRLAQTAQPTGWISTMPAWKDLHSSHIITLSIDNETGPAFFTPLCDALSTAAPELTDAGLFWAMNLKTHRHLLAKAGAYSFQADDIGTMPILGGSIIDLDDSTIPDNQIVGGYGENYIMGERKKFSVDQSAEYSFLQGQTVYRASGYYDGMPAGAGSFVVVRFDGTAPTTEISFTD